jgi:hypothetical protein
VVRLIVRESRVELLALPAHGTYDREMGFTEVRSSFKQKRDERRRLLTRGERLLAWSFAILPAPLVLAAVLVLLQRSRAIGIALLVLAIVMTAVPISPVLSARVRRRERDGTSSTS